MTPIEAIAVVAFPLLILVIVAAVARFFMWRDEKTGEAWGKAAEALELDFQPLSGEDPGDHFGSSTERQISGQVQGGRVLVRWINTPWGNKKFHNRGEFIFDTPLPLPISVKRRGLIPLPTPLRVKTGDAAFDQLIRVSSSQPERAARLLTPSVRAALLLLARHAPKARVAPDRITWNHNDPINDPQRLQDAIDALQQAGSALQTAASDLIMDIDPPATGHHTLPARAEAPRQVHATADATMKKR